MTVYSWLDTPMGPMLAASEHEALTGLWFSGQKHFPKETGTWLHQPELILFQQLQQWLGHYFAGNPQPLELPLRPQGTAFQQEVWQLLMEIPLGKTATYGELAKKIAEHRGLSSMSAQAVGGAVGRNPLSVLIPCHRAVGADGSLTGYAGGLRRKQGLLALERGEALPALSSPEGSYEISSSASSEGSDR